MGLSIHYQGSFKNAIDLPSIIEEVYEVLGETKQRQRAWNKSN